MKFKFSVFVLAIVLIASACSKKDDGNDVVPTDGSITGSVNLYDEGTSSVDNSGMAVTVEGSNPLIKTTTNSSGRFVLNNVPYGVKTLIFEKDGYGTFKKSNVKHAYLNGLSTSLDTTKSLGAKSGTSVTALACQIVGSDMIAEVTTTPSANASKSLYVRLFFDVKSGVSSSNFTAYSEDYIIGINPAKLRFSATALVKLGFHSGQTIYVRAYGDSFWSNEYKDSSTGKMVFPNLNSATASEVKVVLP